MPVEFDEEKQKERLAKLRKKEEYDLANFVAAKHGFRFLDLTAVPINVEALRVMTETEAREANVAPFNIIDKKVDIGILSPQFDKTTAAIKRLEEQGYAPSVYIVTREGLDRVLDRYKDLSFSTVTKGGSLDINNDEVKELLGKIKHVLDVQNLLKETLAVKQAHATSKILEVIVAGALSLSASDIHAEPEETEVRLRYRLDGVLSDIFRFEHDAYRRMLSRLKLLSGLKLNISDKPQDGRFSITTENTDIEIRTSVLPGAYGETVVLRVLDPNSISVSLEEMGIEPSLYEILMREIKKPNGMLLTTGPTGSGKTTTLYAFLKKIYTPEVKIITIENPIEYHLKGIVQTQTDQEKGYTFNEGLRSALRQDPDVIMVGEIRDSETAATAINAALTGHLVFSTLHTNSATGTFPRLIDLGINPKVITSAINVSMAQRLVRRLCNQCKKESVPDQKDQRVMNAAVSSMADRESLGDMNKIWKPVGCEKCNFTGYKGRIGIFEAILSDGKIDAAVQNNPSARDIRKAAAGQGIHSMREDGIIKVLKGITSLEELERVIDLESDE